VTDWWGNKKAEWKAGWEALTIPEKREEAFELIDEYGDLGYIEKRELAVKVAYLDMVKGIVDTGRNVLDSGVVQFYMLEAGRKLGVGGLDDDTVYQITRDTINEKLTNEKKVLDELPQTMVKAVVKDLTHVINPKNAYNYFLNPDAKFGELVDYSRSGISTGLTVYGGAKLLQSSVAITKVGVLGIKQTASNLANSGLQPLAVGGYGSSVSGINNINNALIQMSQAGAQVVVPNISNITSNLTGISNQGSGKLTGKLDGLKQAERKMVDDLLKQGRDVEIIPKDPAAKLKTPDFKVNGVSTELKTIANPNVNTVITKIQNGFQQNAQRVLVDVRNTGLTAQQVQEAITRTIGSYKNGVPGGIEIWYNGGVITYP